MHEQVQAGGQEPGRVGRAHGAVLLASWHKPRTSPFDGFLPRLALLGVFRQLHLEIPVVRHAQTNPVRLPGLPLRWIAIQINVPKSSRRTECTRSKPHNEIESLPCLYIVGTVAMSTEMKDGAADLMLVDVLKLAVRRGAEFPTDSESSSREFFAEAYVQGRLAGVVVHVEANVACREQPSCRHGRHPHRVRSRAGRVYMGEEMSPPSCL